MKKLISLCLALALVLAMAAPAMALSSTMTYKYGSGTVNQWNYTTSTGASKTYAIATLKYEKSTVLYAKIQVSVYKSDDYTFVKWDAEEEAITDTSASASISCGSDYYFGRAYGYYTIAGTGLSTVSVS